MESGKIIASIVSDACEVALAFSALCRARILFPSRPQASSSKVAPSRRCRDPACLVSFGRIARTAAN
jgi:hypothetical protein